MTIYPPIMRCLPKTHKPPRPNGLPKSRPVVGAAKGITTAIGDLISDLIEPIAKVEQETTEAQSTEELLRGIQEANERLKGVAEPDVVLASMDVTALYPSIDQVGSAALVREAFIISEITVTNINWKAAGL